MLVSALIADGPPSRLIEEAVCGNVELLLPDLVLDELEKVVRKKLGFGSERREEARELLVGLAHSVPPAPERVQAVTGDPADDRILACAVEQRVDVVATGDRKHLLPVGEYCGVRMLTPQALLAGLRLPS